MPIQTYVENGCLVGYLPGVAGAEVRVPLSEIVTAAGVRLTAREKRELDCIPGGDTIVGALDAYASSASPQVGGKIARKIKKGLKKGIKKIAKSKLIKGLAKIVKAVTPPPFSVAITAAEGAAKFVKSLKGKNAKKAKSLVPAIQKAAAGKMTPKALEQAARKAGLDPKMVVDAAVIKRVALQSKTDPRAAATLRLATDMTSTEPVQQQLALAAAAQTSAPGAHAFVVQAPGGKTYRTLVQSSS